MEAEVSNVMPVPAATNVVSPVEVTAPVNVGMVVV